MAQGVGALTVSLGLDAAQYVQGLNKADQQARNFSNNYNRNTKSANDANKSFLGSLTATGGQLRALGALGAGVFSVGAIVRTADEYTKLTAQLRLSTENQKQFNEALSSVDRIAAQAQTDLGAVATLYSRLNNSFKGTGTTQQELTDITETATLALKVNGATATESASAILQLSQAFGSGVLRGEEFNAVNEAAPGLLRRVADEMGVEFGALRELASQGKITADVLKRAFTNQEYLEGLRKNVQQVQTVSGSVQSLKNSLTLAVGTFDDATGASKLLSAGLQGVASALSGIVSIASGKPIDLAKFLPNYKAFQDQQKKASEESKKNQISIIPQGSGFGDFIRKDIGTIKDAQDQTKKLTQSVNAFKDANKFTDQQSKLEVYNAKIKELNELVARGAVTNSEAARYRAQFLDELGKGATKAKETTIEQNKAAEDLAQTYADLLLTAQELNRPQDETEADRLERQLNAITGVDSATRSYVETLIAQRRASDDLAEREKENQQRIRDEVEEQIQALKDKEQERFEIVRDQAIEQKQILEEQKNGYKDLARAIDGFAKQGASALADFAFGGKTSFGDFTQSLLKDMARLALQKQIFDPISKGFDGMLSSGGSGGGFGSFFGGIFSGLGFANGGNPPIGKASIVGENGPELLMNRGATTVVPNHAMGGNNYEVNVSVDAKGSSVQGDAGKASELGRAIEGAVKKVLLQEKMNGGLLS
jgi:tape measure domain-containing protein